MPPPLLLLPLLLPLPPLLPPLPSLPPPLLLPLLPLLLPWLLPLLLLFWCRLLRAAGRAVPMPSSTASACELPRA